METAFPSWQYLCHLWPVRAIERVDFNEIQPPTSPDLRVLVTLRAFSPLNHFAMFDDEVLMQWPDVNMKVVTGLQFGVRVSGSSALPEVSASIGC